MAYTHQSDRALQSAAAFFRTQNKDAKGQFRTDGLLPLDPVTSAVTSWEAIKDRFAKDVVFSKYADVTSFWDNAALTMSWTTDLGITGNCVLSRSKAGELSELDAKQIEWGDFKKYVSDLRGKR